MEIVVTRTDFDDECTIGEMTINGEFECYTLEDKTRPVDEPKVFGKTAIPYGLYRVVITFSNHFKRDLPLLLNVPNFEGVRIHPGNYASDTEGCCLVGDGKAKDAITQSRVAFDRLFPKIRDAVEHGEEVTIEYKTSGVS
jgi:hypothetical protein